MPTTPSEYAIQSPEGQLLTGRHRDPVAAWEDYAGRSTGRPAGGGAIEVRFLTRADEPSAPDVLVYSDMDGAPHISFRAPDQRIYYRSADGSRPTEKIAWFVLSRFNPRVPARTALEATARYDPTLPQPTDDPGLLLLRDLLRRLQEQAQQIRAVLREHDRPTDLSEHAVFARRAHGILTTSADPRTELRALLDEAAPG